MAQITSKTKVDVIVVGAGASGSIISAKLAEAGRSVVVLEAGPDRQLEELYSSSIWARQLKAKPTATETGGKDPIAISFNQGHGTGGAALHHYACWFRLHPEDFNVQTQFGKALDWPIDYDTLQPFYDRVQEEVGLSGDADLEVWRPPGEPYPMPPLTQFAQGRLIAEGFKRLGMHTSPLPMAINSVPYKGRPACIYDGWCDAGCPIGALANPLATYLKQAKAAGAEVRSDCHVSRVLTDESGRRAVGVEYFSSDGSRHELTAELVVLGAFAVQNPRILLNSTSAQHPQGLANSSGLVGRYMMAHSAANLFGMFEENTENEFGMTGGQLLCQDDYAKDPEKGYLGSSQWLIGNALKPTDLLGVANARGGLFGQELHSFMHRAASHLATMTLVGENLPQLENQVRLSNEKDRFGFSAARVEHAYSEDDNRCFEAAVARGLEVLEEAGAKEVWVGPKANMHIMGGCIMGRDQRSSVTDSFGRCHDVDNLFVAGTSLFPTSGAVNPTFTVHALALRTAEHISDNWSELTS